MTVESYTVATPSMSTGTFPCGLTAKNSGGLGPQSVCRVQGICSVSYSRPFSASAMRTLVLNGLTTPDHSFMDDLLLASLIDHARSVPVWSSFPGLAIAPRHVAGAPRVVAGALHLAVWTWPNVRSRTCWPPRRRPVSCGRSSAATRRELMRVASLRVSDGAR